MKKLLSFILALAVVLSCLSMVTFTAGAEEEVTKTPDAFKVNVITKGDNYSSQNKNFIFKAEPGFTGVKEIHFAVKNIGNVPASFRPYIQGTFEHAQIKNGDVIAGWKSPIDSWTTHTNKKLEVGEVGIVSIYVPVVDGKVFFGCLADPKCEENGGKHAIDFSKIWLRFANDTDGSSFAVACLNPEETRGAEALAAIGNMSDSATIAWDPIVSSDYFTEDELTKVGVEFALTKTVDGTKYARGNAKLTADMADEDGYIRTSYDVYNISDHPVSFAIMYQADYNEINVNKSYDIPAKTKVTYDLEIPVIKTEDGAYVSFNGQKYDLSTVTLRCQFTSYAAYNVKDSKVIIKANSDNDVLYDVRSVSTEITRRIVSVADIPEYEESSPNYKAVRLVAHSDGTGEHYAVMNSGFKRDDSKNDRMYASYMFYNTSDKDVTVEVTFQQNVGGKWYTPTNDIKGLKRNVPAGTKFLFTVSIVPKNGTVTANSTAQTIDHLLTRFNITASSGIKKGDEFIIESVGDTPQFLSSTETSDKFYFFVPVFEIPEYDFTPAPTPAPTIVPSTNGDVSNGMSNWKYWNAGTATVTTDPGDDDQAADDTNNVIHFVPSVDDAGNVKQYSSVFFDFGPYIVQDAALGYYGNGVGTYRIKFRMRADENFAQYKEETNAKCFVVTLNSVAHTGKGVTVYVDGVPHKMPEQTYSRDTSTYYFDDQWMWVTAYIDVTALELEALNLMRHSDQSNAKYAYEFGLRLDGSGDSKPYGANANQNFGYYIDDLSIEVRPAQSGVKLEVKEDLDSTKTYFSRTPANLTAAMADGNGLITRSYTVYNTSNKPVKILMQLQGGSDYQDANNNYVFRGWDDLFSKDNARYSYTQVIPAYGKYTFNLQAYVNEEGLVKHVYKAEEAKALGTTEAYGYCAPENVYLRFQISSGLDVSKGTVLYVESHNGEDDALYSMNWNTYSSIYNSSGVYWTEEYPDYDVENKFEAASLDIGSSLTLNYLVSFREGFENSYVRISRGDDVRIVYGKLITEGEHAGKYLFVYTGINAQCMTDTIDAELIYNDSIIAMKKNYSVKTYASNLYNSVQKPASNELKTLLANMLAYGAEVQEYVKYKTDDLATDGLNWTVTEFAKPLEEDVVRIINQPDAAHKVISVGLNISYVNKIYFRLGFTDYENVTINVTKDGNDVEFTFDEEQGIVYTDDIFATGFGEEYIITITSDAGVNTVEYNVNAYLYNKYDSASVGTIVRALNNYGAAANAYK